MAVGLLGIDPLPFLEADRLTSQVLNEVVSQAVDLRDTQLRNLAIETANALSRALGG